MKSIFDYTTAFSRNIGWITETEQEFLRHRRIAIAGMGGVGGNHLLTLTRLGIGKFKLADFDTFGIENFNRQAGATLTTIGQPKVEVLANNALNINPNLELDVFPEGLTKENMGNFLDDADLYLDGLDFFAVKIRRLVFAACSKMEIPAITAAPLGMGAAVINFLPGKMTFEEYFQLESFSENEQLLRFFIGLAPAGLQQRYLVDPKTIDLPAHKGPSTIMGCEMCAGVAASQVLKILLQRGKVLTAPHALQYDAFQNRATHTWRPFGNKNPLQQLSLAIAKRKLLS